jgi:branched-chain amino acid transport system ATP-binding protein
VLAVENLSSRYGRVEVLHGISLHVEQGEIVCLIGSNGAGKTTLLRAISGVQTIAAGSITFDGRDISGAAPHARVSFGIAQVPEGRQIFGPLSVEDNLRLGAWTRSDSDIGSDLETVFEMFPVLRQMRAAAAGSLSGGQQQMLAIGRALMSRPKLLLLDEPSMGLAPILVQQILDAIAGLRDRGTTVLLVEQNVTAALAIADRAYVLETGRIALVGTAGELTHDERVRSAYLGI